jgi:glucose/mannose-6-phosphate isomerase
MTLPSSLLSDDMRNMVDHFPQLLTTLKLDDEDKKVMEEYSKGGVEGICFLGMGGSSIAGNYVKSLLSDRAKIPISVVRDYSLPAFVTSKWVVIAVSYSGNTEETIASLTNADEIGARIIVLTSGGRMAEDGRYLKVEIPAGIQPRAALPLMFSIALPIAELVAGLPITDLDSLSKVLSKNAMVWNEWIQTPESLAKLFVKQIPLFIGSQHLIPVAYRAKCQVNENSKALAFQSELPESNHNEIESFVSTFGCKIIPIFLRSKYESKDLAKRFRITQDIYNELGLKTVELSVKGKSKIEEMLIFTHYLDMVSVEFADQLGADPVSVERISDLKHRLSRL